MTVCMSGVDTFLCNAITRVNLNRVQKFQLWVVDLSQAQTPIDFGANWKWFKAAAGNKVSILGYNYRMEASDRKLY